jgi:hypothetical protein
VRKTEMWAPRPTKGFIPTGERLIMFDAIRKCRDERCPLDAECPYDRSGVCLVERTYLREVLADLTKIPRDKMTQEFLNKVSLHLVPLFHQLIKFQIRAYQVEEVCYTTNQGAIKIHPIYAEIRKTIAAIENTQKSLGIDLEYHRALGLVRGVKGTTKNRDPEAYGDSGYADDLVGEVEEIREEIADSLFPEGRGKPVYPTKRAKREDPDTDPENYADELAEDSD